MKSILDIWEREKSTMIAVEAHHKENSDFILEYINSQLVDDEQYYIMLDEVQLLEDFEELLNSMLYISKADTYVTGSNSKFLSKDIITEFIGRGDEIHIYPLCFREFMEVYEGDQYKGFANILKI